MQRNLDEIIASQNTMLLRSGKENNISDDKVKVLLNKDLAKIKSWLLQQKNMAVLFLRYEDVISSPQPAAVKIDDFIGLKLNISKMAEAVKKDLYRNRLQKK